MSFSILKTLHSSRSLNYCILPNGECDYINTRSFYPKKFLVLSTSRYFKGFDLIGLSFKIQSRIEFLESFTRPKKTLTYFAGKFLRFPFTNSRLNIFQWACIFRSFSAIWWRTVWVCLTILWGWTLKYLSSGETRSEMIGPKYLIELESIQLCSL